MRWVRFAAIAAIGAAVSGCATIIQGTTQPISVTSTPEEGAQCTLRNSQGVWYVTTPGSTTVHKTKTDLSVDCTKPGFGDGHALARAHFGGTTFGNIILGGAVGVGVDAASGANFYYDSPIVVALGPKIAGAENAPPPAPFPPQDDPNNHPPKIDQTYPHPQPPYPDSAQLNGEEGTVILSVKVGDNGKVRNVIVAKSSGFADLDNAAIEGVLRWRFVPAMENGDTATEWTNITIVFRLPRPPAVNAAPAPSPSSPPPSGH